MHAPELLEVRKPRSWSSDNLRDDGEIIEISSDKQYMVDFRDGEERKFWQRKVLRFVSRPEHSRKARRVDVSESESGTDVENGAQNSLGQAHYFFWNTVFFYFCFS